MCRYLPFVQISQVEYYLISESGVLSKAFLVSGGPEHTVERPAYCLISRVLFSVQRPVPHSTQAFNILCSLQRPVQCSISCSTSCPILSMQSRFRHPIQRPLRLVFCPAASILCNILAASRPVCSVTSSVSVLSNLNLMSSAVLSASRADSSVQGPM